MIKEDYRFDTKEALKREWLFVWIFSIFICLGLPTFLNWGHLKLEDYFSWPILIFPGAVFIAYFIVWFCRRGIFYEVSSTKLVKRRGKRILRSVKLSDVQGVIGKYPVRLKITDQRDFIFDSFIIGSSNKKLQSFLQESGITKIKKKIDKQEIMRHLLLFLTIPVNIHFVGSIEIWWLFGLYFHLKYFKEYPIDWVMFLHAIPAVVLYFASIAAFISAYKNKILKSLITLGLVLVISLLCFFIETTNNLFQGFYTAHVIGDIHYFSSFGWRYQYFTWWWYENVVEVFPEVTYKYGCIDKTGRIVAEPQFDRVYGLSENLARIELDDKYGYIDKNGTIIVKPNYSFAEDFREGLAEVMIEGKWGYINKTGKVVIDPVFDYTNNFSEGLASVEIGNKWGYINQKGELVIKCKYDRARYFKEGLASVKIDDKSGFINSKGEFVIEPQFDSARDFSEGLAVVIIDDLYTYIDKTGQIITEKRFKRARNFSEGLAAVRIDRKWGYINKEGNIIIKCQYELVYPFSDGRAIVGRHNDRWGYRSGFILSVIAQNGENITDLKFSRALRFSEGLASIVNEDRCWGYIDKKGEVVIRPPFDIAYPFSEGIATVGVKNAKEGNNE
ncbi:MAG: WG repeat-containing protein [Planctomycetota bacterium]|jgi:hypothetical protein